MVVPTPRPPFQYTTFNILNGQIIKCLLTLENPRPFGLPMLGQILASTKNSKERKRGRGEVSMKKFVKNFLSVAKIWRKKKNYEQHTDRSDKRDSLMPLASFIARVYRTMEKTSHEAL